MSSYLSFAYNFWMLTRNSIQQMELQGNGTIKMFSLKNNLTDGDIKKRYDELTKWNDQNIGIPIFFNFYHGLELYMKGLLDSVKIKFNTNHNIKSLFELIKTNENLFTKEIILLLKQHIHNANSYTVFFKSNEIDIAKFYDCFRYPENKFGDKKYFYGEIRGKEKETLKIYIELKKATIDFENAIIKWLNKDNHSDYLKTY